MEIARERVGGGGGGGGRGGEEEEGQRANCLLQFGSGLLCCIYKQGR